VRPKPLHREKHPNLDVEDCFGWSDIDLAYAAGLIEGEGSFYTNKARDRRYARVSISCSTDEDVLVSLQRRLGVGHVHGPYGGSRPGRFPNAKPYWLWMVTKKDDAARLIKALYPYMGKRRRDQAARVWMEVSESVS
jgi:hypothetical protein